MPGEDIQSWSVTAINNGNSDTAIEWREGQTRASVNNSARSMMATHAKNRNLLNGSITTGGTANAQTFTSGVSYIAPIPTGLIVKLKIGASLTNTTSATLNMDGIGDTTIKDDQGNNLRGGELVANAYTDFLYNGTNWVFLYSHAHFIDLITSGDGIIISTQVFNASGTYTPSASMVCCTIECIGGGGGGGNAQAATGEYMAGAGGGSGGYSRKLATAVDIGLSQVVTVGAGGAAGGPGLSGGATSVGTLCVANGGGGGGYAQGAFGVNIPDAGAGAASGTGDITAAGTPGTAGYFNINSTTAYTKNATGGSGAFGGGGRGGLGTGYPVNGIAGGNYGGGGGGGASYSGLGTALGGAGGAGVVIITEFAGRGPPGANGATGATGPMGPAGPSGAGTGDVLRSGTPTVGQIAEWVDGSHIRGVTLAFNFSTGDIKPTFKTTADTGWVMLDDGTIGSTASSATTRHNDDTLALFTLLWNNITNTNAPVSGGRGGSAAADFAANKTLTLPKALGRVMMGAGVSVSTGITTTLGEAAGSMTHTMVLSELPPHTHNYYGPTSSGESAATGSDVSGLWSGVSGTAATASPVGAASVPFNLLQPSVSVNFMCKL